MNKVSIRLKNGTVDYAQKTETLLAGSCDAFFPMSIIRDKKTRGAYSTRAVFTSWRIWKD